MSSTYQPNILTFKADGAIAKGSAVKIGTDKNHVAKCTASTDKAIGVAQGDTSTAEDLIEVAMPGGGGKVLAHGTYSAGMLLAPYTDGSLQKISGANDRCIAMLLEDCVVGDLAAAHIVVAQAVTTES